MSRKLIITAIFVAFLTLSLGFVCPFLFSAKSDILLILGVLYTVIIASISVFYYNYIKNDLQNKSQILILLIGVLPMISSCSKVPSGNVGIKVYLLGENKGVDSEVLGVGRLLVGY